MSENDNESSFSVWVFFPDGEYMAEKRGIGAEEACQLAKQLTKRPASQIGLITKILITDGGDCCVFEWRYGKGVVFPRRDYYESL